MHIDAAMIQDYAAGRLDATDMAAVARAVRYNSKIARSVQRAMALTRRVELRLGARTGAERARKPRPN